MADGSPEHSDLSFHKALGSLNYCIKISNGVALRNQKSALDIKLEKLSTVQVFEKLELEEDPFIDENIIKEEATQSFIKSEEEDTYHLITNDVKDEVKKIVKSQKESTEFRCDQCNYKTGKKRNLKMKKSTLNK